MLYFRNTILYIATMLFYCDVFFMVDITPSSDYNPQLKHINSLKCCICVQGTESQLKYQENVGSPYLLFFSPLQI